MSEKKSVIFELTEPLEYTNTKTAKKEETLEIEMFAPSRDTAKYVYKLSQHFMKSVFHTQNLMSDIEEKQRKKEEKMDADAVRVIFFSSEISFSKVEDDFINMSNKVCFLDGDKKIPLTRTLINKISLEDMATMTCSYVANFIVPFAMPTT